MNHSHFSKIKTHIHQFFFLPARSEPLAALRIGLCSILLWQAYCVGPLLFELYGQEGIIQGKIASYFAPVTPHITGMTRLMMPWGISETTVLTVISILYLTFVACFLVGFQSRITGIGTWFTHMLLAQGHTASYGFDAYAHIFLFYLAFTPSGTSWSIDSKFKPSTPSPWNRLSLRTLQLHVAIAYCASAIEKATGIQWWNGDAIWRSLMLPIYRQHIPVEWIAQIPWIAMVAGWATLAIEAFYPFLIFPQKTRPLWIVLVMALHLGIVFFLGLHIFGIFMCVLTFALFAFSSEPETPILVFQKGPQPLREKVVS